jgi:hypothetical protein
MGPGRFRTLFLCLTLELGLLVGIPIRPEDVARMVRRLALPGTEQTDPDDAEKGDGVRS